MQHCGPHSLLKVTHEESKAWPGFHTQPIWLHHPLSSTSCLLFPIITCAQSATHQRATNQYKFTEIWLSASKWAILLPHFHTSAKSRLKQCVLSGYVLPSFCSYQSTPPFPPLVCTRCFIFISECPGHSTIPGTQNISNNC
jgi:hypothetical protein